MKAKRVKIFWILIFQIAMLSCNSVESDSPVDIEDDYINQQIQLLVPNQFNSFETISPVVLEVRYFPKVVIVFPNNNNIKIFEKTPKEWKEIPE